MIWFTFPILLMGISILFQISDISAEMESINANVAFVRGAVENLVGYF